MTNSIGEIANANLILACGTNTMEAHPIIWYKINEALRKGAQSLADSMQQGEGEGQGEGPGNRAGRQQSGGNQSDPLGRPLHGREFGDDFTVKIPGEIDVQRARRILEELRRRLGDPQRPQLELDYLERLLKDY